jgi:hypothetical protein
MQVQTRHRWLESIILATQEDCAGQIVHETLSQKNLPQKKGWWSGSRCRPWVQTPVLQRKKKKNTTDLANCSCVEHLAAILSLREATPNTLNDYTLYTHHLNDVLCSQNMAGSTNDGAKKSFRNYL